MNDNNIKEVKERLENILINNMSFYRSCPEDKKMYNVDFISIVELAYEILQYSATVYGAAHGTLATYRWIKPKKKSIEKKFDSSDAVLSNDSLRKKLGILRMNMNNENLKAEFKVEIQKILEYHGWPIDEACSDSEKILKSFII